jgi:hypothetical protein
VLDGRLSDFDVPTLMDALSLGRTVMVLEVLAQAGGVLGCVSSKGGRVLAASAGSLTGEAALEKLMQEAKDARFRVYSDASAVPTNQPIGTVADFAPAQKVRPPVSTRTHSPIPESGIRRVPVMAGKLGEFHVATLMQVVSSGRQHTGLEVVNERSEVLGTIYLKAGKVVSARAGTVDGVAAVCEILRLPQKLDFAIFRVPGEVVGEPLGSVTDILLLAAGPESVSSADGIPRARVMEGSVADADVTSLIQVLGSSRQHTELELFRSDGSFAGTIQLKAGKLLEAKADELRGVAAVGRLLTLPADCRFSALRRLAPSELSELVGSVGDVLLRARALDGSAAGEGTAQSRSLVMQGNLAEFGFASVLQVISTSRLRASLQVFDSDLRLIGEVGTKAGRMLWARAGRAQGEAALRSLLRAPRSSKFAVARVPEVLDPTEAEMGLVSDLLLRAMTAEGVPVPTAAPLAAPFPAPHAAPLPVALADAQRRPNQRRRMAWTATAGVLGAALIAGGFFVAGQSRPPEAAPPREPAPTAEIPVAAFETTPTPTPTAATPTPAAAAAKPTPAATVATAQSPTTMRSPDTSARQFETNRTYLRKMQSTLKRKGFDPGPIDGWIGPLTRGGIRAFQRAENLPVDGTLNEATRAALTARSRKN